MNRKGVIAVVLVAVLLIASIGIAYVYMNKGSSKETNDGPFSITDDRGVTVNFTAAPDRIVSLGSSFTDILVSLGGKDKIVGVDSSSATVSEINANTTNLGSVSSLSLEALLDLDPDVVIMWDFTMYAPMISNIEAMDLNVVALYPKNVSTTMSTMEDLGKLIGSDASELVEELQDRMDAITSVTSTLAADQRTSIYLELASKGGQTVSNGTLSNELIEMAGGTNIFANGTGNWMANYEEVIEKQPDVIVIENSSIKTTAELKEDLAATPAVENDRVYRITQGTLTISPKMVDALEDLAYWLHPDLFPELAPQ
jgi:iron complex transport system substrate-binding protein